MFINMSILQFKLALKAEDKGRRLQLPVFYSMIKNAMKKMKNRITTLFACGILMIALPFTGFPDSWKTFFAIIIGLVVCAIAYQIRNEFFPKKSLSAIKKTESFAENSPARN
jgi:uncharacterized membrane protein